jgi:putative ATP-dependent endonuclease of the OLD family
MRVTELKIENFRGIKSATLHFDGHTLLIGGNNVGKSTICEALDLVLGPDRLNRNPPVEEFDFYNAKYLADDETTLIPIRIDVVLTELTDDIKSLCASNLEFWEKNEKRLLAEGEIKATDSVSVELCLRLTTIAHYDPEEDQFVARTIYTGTETESEGEPKSIPNRVKRSIGFLYLRTLRTGSRALSLERGTLLDIILRMKELRTGLWERIRKRLLELNPSIDEDATELAPILDEIEARLGEYVTTAGVERSTRLFVSQLTREHLRKTIAFFLSMCQGETPIPFQNAGTGTLNTLVLALLTFIAEIKKDNVIFAMEEPEIALPPHTQRRIANYLLTQTTQCFVTSHSPYVIERFEPKGIMRLTRNDTGVLTGKNVNLPSGMKPKMYRSQIRRAIAEAILGQGVIVGEGITEQLALATAATKMAEANPELFEFDLAGITIINTEGEGNLSAMGNFFKELDIPAFAYFDKKNRSEAQLAEIQASFTLAKEIGYKGAEALLAAEVPIEQQWKNLETIRSGDTEGNYGIPQEKPNDDRIRELTVSTLKGLKGTGAAADLISNCSVDELPTTIVEFLKAVYDKFPRPKRREKSPKEEQPAASTIETTQSEESAVQAEAKNAES